MAITTPTLIGDGQMPTARSGPLSFNNDEDYVVLLNNEMQVIDEFLYDEKMHMQLLHEREGVSLERISFSAETNDRNNWYSASL